jgi:hypothetical protein
MEKSCAKMRHLCKNATLRPSNRNAGHAQLARRTSFLPFELAGEMLLVREAEPGCHFLDARIIPQQFSRLPHSFVGEPRLGAFSYLA